MTPSLRDPDLFPRLALALTEGQSAAEVALSCYQKPLLTKRYGLHTKQIERGSE